MDGLTGLLFVVLAISCVVGLALHHSFLSRLRTRHPGTWDALGRPTLFLNNSIGNGLAVQRFLWRRQYRELPDEQFIRFADFLRRYYIAYAILFAVMIALFVANIAINGHGAPPAK